MVETLVVIDIIRFLVGFCILLYASYTDINTRKAANILWWIMGGIGAILLLVQFFTPEGFGGQIYYLIFIPIMFGFMYLVFLMPVNFGGADVKAIWALSILVPFTPFLFDYPLYPSAMPFVWYIFTNALLLNLSVPITLLIYNIIKKDIKFPFCILGYKTPIENAKEKFLWPLEKIVDGKPKIFLLNHSFEPSDEFEELEKHGYKKIWVTPWVPFIITLLAGYITAFIFGDILTFIIQLFI